MVPLDRSQVLHYQVRPPCQRSIPLEKFRHLVVRAELYGAFLILTDNRNY